TPDANRRQLAVADAAITNAVAWRGTALRYHRNVGESPRTPALSVGAIGPIADHQNRFCLPTDKFGRRHHRSDVGNIRFSQRRFQKQHGDIVAAIARAVRLWRHRTVAKAADARYVIPRALAAVQTQNDEMARCLAGAMERSEYGKAADGRA